MLFCLVPIAKIFAMIRSLNHNLGIIAILSVTFITNLTSVLVLQQGCWAKRRESGPEAYARHIPACEGGSAGFGPVGGAREGVGFRDMGRARPDRWA